MTITTAIPNDTYLLDNVARFVGQRMVAVVAESEAAAEEGCRRVEIEYEVPPAVFDPEAAMQTGAPVLTTRVRSRASGAPGRISCRHPRRCGRRRGWLCRGGGHPRGHV